MAREDFASEKEEYILLIIHQIIQIIVNNYLPFMQKIPAFVIPHCTCFWEARIAIDRQLTTSDMNIQISYSRIHKHLQIHVAFERVLSQQVPDNLQRLGESFRQRPHGRALGLSIHDRRASCQALRAEPKLTGQILLHHIIGELYPEVPIGAALGYQLVHDLITDGQHLVLTLSQLIHQRGASLRLLPTIEGVQLAGYRVQGLVGVKELSQQTCVVPLQR